MPSSKRYSENEIRKILTKASEIQLETEHQEIQKKGLTQDELMEIAQEVGISKEYLKLALHTYKSNTQKDFNWLKGTSELKSEIEMDEEVTELQLDQLFPELNAFTGQKGAVEEIGNSYDWEQVENGFESIRRVTVIRGDGKTKITQYVNWNDLRFLGLPLSTIMGVVLLMIIIKFLGFPKSIFLPISLAGGVIGYFGFITGLKFYFEKQRQKFASISKLITDTLSRPAQHRSKMKDSLYPADAGEEKGNNS